MFRHNLLWSTFLPGYNSCPPGVSLSSVLTSTREKGVPVHQRMETKRHKDKVRGETSSRRREIRKKEESPGCNLENVSKPNHNRGWGLDGPKIKISGSVSPRKIHRINRRIISYQPTVNRNPVKKWDPVGDSTLSRLPRVVWWTWTEKSSLIPDPSTIFLPPALS